MIRMQAKRFALGCAAALVLAGCFSGSTGRMRPLDARPRAARGAERPSVVMSGVRLTSGQIVLTEAPGDLSMAFSLIPDKFYPFTHAGIVSVESGQAYVYDVTGEVKMKFKKKVLDNVSGKMYRRSFFEYVAPNLYAEVYDPPDGVDGERVAAFARKKYAEGLELDAHFRFEDHEKMFCTELVELALRDAGAKPNQLAGVHDNPSLHTAMRWLDVPMTTTLPAGIFVDPDRYIGAFGQFPSRTHAYAYFEGKREVYRRFTKNQRLGYIFELEPTGVISLRPRIASFLDDAAHAYDGDRDLPEPGDPRIRARVREIADRAFGRLDDALAPG